MPTSCCARLCDHNSRNCKLKTFPTDGERARKWEANMRRPHWQRKSHHRLCECHFEPDQFTNNRLLHDAIPTLFPTHRMTLNLYSRRKIVTKQEISSNGDTSRDFDGGSEEKQGPEDNRIIEGSIPASYLATTIMDDQESSEEDDEEIFFKNEGTPQGIISTEVPGPVLEHIMTLQKALDQKSSQCQKIEEESGKLREEMEQLQSEAAKKVDGKLSFSDYQIQDLKGTKFSCFAVERSSFKHLMGKGIVPKSVTEEHNYSAVEEITDEETESGEEDEIDSLQERLVEVEGERDALQSANSQLIAEKAEILNKLLNLEAEHRRTFKELWKTQQLNNQLNSDNQKLIESLRAQSNLPNG